MDTLSVLSCEGCPVTCPLCGHEQPDGFVECSKCGVIFGKIHTNEEKNHIRIDENVESAPSSPAETLEGLFFSVKTDPDPDPIILSLKAILIAIILIWGLKLFFTPIEEAGNNILHYVNLPFHEAGHIFF
ncbi:MAG: hypothetical protein ACLQDF_05875, partial [Desulfomonilia bacterium]